MKKNTITILTLIIGTLIAFQSCKKEEGGENENGEKKISTYNDTESHNGGLNCMSCHVSGGSGEGWFNVAGTVYDTSQTSIVPNATVKLYTEPNGAGDLKATIEVDGLGNFYTTDNIDFGLGLYPSVTGNTSTQHMSASILAAQCNNCHGITTGKIWVY